MSTTHVTRSGKSYDPHDELCAQVASALKTVFETYPPDDTSQHRDLTPAELDAVCFALSTALIMLQKLPGGRDAHKRAIERAKAELIERGRNDLVEQIDGEK